jgi:hypothetical protein
LQTVVNPKTDIGADEFIRLAADVAALARVAAFATGLVQCEDTPADIPIVQSIRQMTAISSTGYIGDSPTHSSFPTVARLGNGSIEIEWPADAVDEYGVLQVISLSHVHAWLSGNPTGHYLTISLSGNVLTLSAFNDSDAAIAGALIAFEVA